MTAAEQERAAEAGEDMPEEPDEEPEESRFLSLEELVGTTVGAVMEEHQEPLLKPRRGLFSRKRQQVDTEQFYDPVDAPPPPKPVTEADTIGDEPELDEVASEYRADCGARAAPWRGHFSRHCCRWRPCWRSGMTWPFPIGQGMGSFNVW